MVIAADVLDGLDGLCSLRIICKSASCVKLTGVINTDLVVISYVNCSGHLARVLHEVVISMVSDLGSASLETAVFLPCKSVACVEKCVLSV